MKKVNNKGECYFAYLNYMNSLEKKDLLEYAIGADLLSDRLQQRIDKAIEYIEIYNEEENPDYASSFINKNDNTYVLFDEYRESLLNILRGGSDKE